GGRLAILGDLLPELRSLESRLHESLEPNGEVRDAASTELASLRRRKRSAQSRLLERVQSYTSGKHREWLSDPIYTVRDGRYVVPVKAEHRSKVRGIVHDTSGTGQTLFVEPEDVLQLGNALREVEAAEAAEIERVLSELSGAVGAEAVDIATGIDASGEIDLLLAKARLGYAIKATPPERLRTPRVEIEGGRHPLLDPQTVVPLDIALGVGDSVLITGPNTGGKTVAIKAVGLLVLMAQSGLMPPARAFRLGTFAQAWADIGDEQSISQSLSTFSGHVKNIAEALRKLQPGALVLLDEIGAGTDPAEGAALAKSILSEIHARGACALASTHYGELKAFAYETDGFTNAAMEFDAKSLMPTYHLRMGAPGASQALRIAERYGLPAPVVEGARGNLSQQHQDVARMLERLEEAQRLARQAQSEADRRAAELHKVEEIATRKLAEASEIRKTAQANAAAELESALREIRLEAAEIFEELKAQGGGQAREAARDRLRALQTAGEARTSKLRPQAKTTTEAPAIQRGMSVKIEGYPQAGIVLDEPRGGRVPVQIGSLKVQVEIGALTPAARPPPTAPRRNLGFERAATASTELHLREMRAEEALRILEKFLDDSLLAGLSTVRIVHGKGEGVLRKLTQDCLRRHKDVASFRDGEPGEGGHGVTVATLK
ncbi:MAG: endonuclease MutS2, partial [Fimbriimonas ginsengisoli]|nr:endonuclease MutS2 [Fimbriimonas ginsengisoli]